MARATLTTELQTLLTSLSTTAYPDLPSPPDCSKRASVALIIRVRPSYSHWPPSSASTNQPTTLPSFFAQDWVAHGSPEILFIKRASRKGDRWTSHIALPGGKRDPDDASDQAAAVREAVEEVGLDVEQHGIACGNLPQRIVTTHWGKKPLLVLCPYVFLVTEPAIPPLRLQPSEVASTHWVPLHSLQSPDSRTVVFEDVSSRLANQETGLKIWVYASMLGQMMFAAIDLQPTESLYSTESPAEQPKCALQNNRHAPPTTATRLRALFTRLYRSDIFAQLPAPRTPAPLHLWGLTLGVISDFLDLLPPHDALTLWTYPTFTPLDVRFAVWLATYNFKARKRAELQAGTQFLGTKADGKGKRAGVGGLAFGLESESVAPGGDEVEGSTVLVERDGELEQGQDEMGEAAADETGLHGLGTGATTSTSTTSPSIGRRKSETRMAKKPAVQTMLSGYYEILRRAVAVALVGRLGLLVAIVAWLVRRQRRRRAMGM